jgi:hypothetical protein
MQGLKGKRQKNMGLLKQTIKTKIYYDGRKGIPHNIMGCHPLNVMKKMNPHGV